jgi:hypothetical protein
MAVLVACAVGVAIGLFCRPSNVRTAIAIAALGLVAPARAAQPPAKAPASVQPRKVGKRPP